MDLFNLRKNKDKDRDVEEYFMKGSSDEHEENNISSDIDEEKDVTEENISDYIDPDDLNYDNYQYIIDTIEAEGWTQMSSVSTPLTILDEEIVFPRQIKANTYDNILEIICPPERIITICGTGECDIDPDDFNNAPNFYQIPHFFTLRCMNNDNVEIAPTTIISILKVMRDEELEKYYQEFYGDLSSIIDGRLKRKEERYYFAETIILQSGERLVFRANSPNIDIAKMDLLMMSDIFEKDEEEQEE